MDQFPCGNPDDKPEDMGAVIDRPRTLKAMPVETEPLPTEIAQDLNSDVPNQEKRVCVGRLGVVHGRDG